MIDKLLLNNQFLAHKRKIQQAKVNVINKLVHKIRKIKRANEKQAQNIRLKTKLQRTEQILTCVKKLKNVDVLKKSLVNERKPNSVITNGNAAQEAVAEALLFKHKLVSEITRQLKELCHLNDTTNPGWKDQVLELSKRKKKLLRIGFNTKQGKKDRNKKLKRQNEWHENSLLLNDIQEAGESNDQSESQGWNVSIDSTTEHVENVRTPKIDKPTKQITTNREEHNEIVKEIEETTSISQKQPTHAVDSFFVTKAGDNYLSTAVIDRVQAEFPDDGLVRKQRRAERFGNVYKKASHKKNDKFWDRNNTKCKFEIKSNKHNNERTASATNEGLHPSWAAKQKQKGIPEFHGKKIKFEDDENGNIGEKIKCKSLNENKDKEKLHPSWEAKQKMKPIIADFKGTRIVFNDDQ